MIYGDRDSSVNKGTAKCQPELTPMGFVAIGKGFFASMVAE